MNRNLFNEETLPYLTEQDINRYISVYGGLVEPLDFANNPGLTLSLLWELVTAKCGKVCFEYTIGACIVSGAGTRVTGGTVGRAVANLFIELIRKEAAQSVVDSRK